MSPLGLPGPAEARHERRPGQDPAKPVRGGNGMITRLVKAALLAAVLAAIVQSLPDVKRYLELREM